MTHPISVTLIEREPLGATWRVVERECTATGFSRSNYAVLLRNQMSLTAARCFANSLTPGLFNRMMVRWGNEYK